jgi:hypothetical protein
MRHAFFLASAAALVACGCNGAGDGTPTDGPRADMMKILDAARATGAAPYGDVLWYTRDNLYDYINGMAEEFLGAGFVRLAHSEWKAAEATGNAYVEIDVYDMGSPKGVAAVMTAPPDDKTSEVAPGVRAYRDEGFCEFGAGRYYVKLTARPDAEGQEALLDALARAVAEKASASGP